MEAKEVRSKLGRAIQLEYKNESWLAHINQDKLEEGFGVRPESHILSGDDGIKLFNEISEKEGVDALSDPKGYMSLDNNISAYIHDSYREQYENALDDIAGNFKDGTGYGVEHVLKSLSSTVRKNIKEYLPENTLYGDLRFVEATGERTLAVDKFVQERLSKTVAYEKSRSDDADTKERNHQRFVSAGENMRDALSDTKQEKLELEM